MALTSSARRNRLNRSKPLKSQACNVNLDFYIDLGFTLFLSISKATLDPIFTFRTCELKHGKPFEALWASRCPVCAGLARHPLCAAPLSPLIAFAPLICCSECSVGNMAVGSVVCSCALCSVVCSVVLVIASSAGQQPWPHEPILATTSLRLTTRCNSLTLWHTAV